MKIFKKPGKAAVLARFPCGTENPMIINSYINNVHAQIYLSFTYVFEQQLGFKIRVANYV